MMQLLEDPIKLAAPTVVIVVLICLFWKFWRRYRNPAKVLATALGEGATQILEVKKLPRSERRKAASLVFEQGMFKHQWNEYQETLHDQFIELDGERVISQTRATIPASLYYSTQSVVDTPLRAEYFRHLPGIMTGLGIIGTFFGLMLGLGQFDLGAPEKVQESVTGLIQDVFCAFIGSLFAIACAMFVTHIEKEWLRVCYERLEKMTDAVDGLFDAGVGEEYLADLVRTSQESSVQTRMLKDSLVTDLREMLQNLVETQVRENLKLAETLSGSYRESGSLLASQISDSIESSFRDPLQRIADSVSAASGDQSQMVGTMLQDVLVAFMAKLEGTFGQQFQGMSAMLEQSVGTMQSMQSGLAALVNDLRSASEESSQAVSQQLAKTLQNMHSSQEVMQASLDQMVQTLGNQGVEAGSKIAAQLERMYSDGESRQQQMADQMEAFVQQLRDSVGRGQTETIDQIAGTVRQLEQQMQTMIDGVGQSITRAQEDGLRSVSSASEALTGRIEMMFATLDKGRLEMDHAAQTALHSFQEQATSVLTGLSAEVRSLTELVERERHAMRQTIDALGGQTERSLLGMQAGADKMRLAADRFDSAGTSIHDTLQSSGEMVATLRASSVEVAGATRDLASVVADYRASRDVTVQNMQTLQAVIETAQQEATLREKAVGDLMRLSEQIHKLNHETNEYLDQVSGVLGRSFDEFGTGIERTLTKTMGALDAELDKAVRSLAGGVETVSEHIEDLSDVLGKASLRVVKG
jgi:ABC-type transporter Mla subunit MlaD